MKFPFIASLLVFLSTFPFAGQASAAPLTLKDGTVLKGDFVLKDGTVLKGEVIRMQGDAYVIEYQWKPNIKDIKIVPKQDVVKIVSEKLDEKAFLEIAKLTPTPDLLTVDDYKQRLLAVKTFLTRFPKSAKLKEVNAISQTLTEECAEVAAGGRKIQGSMIKGADYRANAFDLDARVLEAKIRSAAKNSQWLMALRAFADLDKEYQSAACYREVLPVVLKVLQEIRAQVAASLASYDARMEKQTSDLEKMSQTEREDTRRALDEQAAKLEKSYQLEKKSQQVWVTPHANHKQSLEDNNSLAESELQRLSTAVEPATVDGGKIFRDAWKVVHSDADAEAMDKALADAEAAALPARYLKLLQDAAAASGAKPSEEK
jgi:hypothetical protein